MRKPRFSEAFILEVLGSVQDGVSVRAACVRYGICEATFLRWREKYGSMKLSESRRLQQILEENRRLRSLVSELTTDNQALLGVLSKQWQLVEPPEAAP